MHLENKTKKELIARLQSLRGNEIESTIEILWHLHEIAERKIELQMGYSSLYEFAETELGYDAGEAYIRIRASQLLALDPMVEVELRSKNLSLTSLMLSQVAFNQENKRRRQVDLPALTLLEKVAVVRQVAGSVKNAKRVLAECFPELQKDIEKTTPLRNGRTRITFSANAELMAMFRDLKDLMSSKNFDGKWEPFFFELAKMGLQKLDPERRKSEQRASASKPQSKTFSKRKSIPVQDKRTTRAKAQHQCQYVDPESGRRCCSTHDLQIDHEIPVALGGTNEIGNLRVLCGRHNRFVAWRGKWVSHGPQNRFKKIAARSSRNKSPGDRPVARRLTHNSWLRFVPPDGPGTKPDHGV